MAKAENVVPFTGDSVLPTDPANVLLFAGKHTFDRVTIIGRLANGEDYLASSEADPAAVLWEIEHTKRTLLRSAGEFD